MKNIKVELVVASNVEPISFIGGLARLTQCKDDFKSVNFERGKKVLDSLMQYGHTSLLEAIDLGIVISGASRVTLAQLTRHRLSSFVSQSQQYQDQTGSPFVVPESVSNNAEALELYEQGIRAQDELYNKLKALGIDKDDARYVLPNALRNDLFIKTNVREWIQSILKLRLCKRNTSEVCLIARKILTLFVAHGYGPLFKYAGPTCVTCGMCDQGKMACGEPYGSWEELLVSD